MSRERGEGRKSEGRRPHRSRGESPAPKAARSRSLNAVSTDPPAAERARSPVGLIVQLVFVALASAGVFGFVQAARSDELRSVCTSVCAMRPTYAARNRLAPDFELPDFEGRTVRLSSYRGKTVVLNFWTKTCQPCLEEMPSLHELGKVLKQRGDAVLLTISTDEGPEAVKDTLDVLLGGEEPSFVVLFDPELDVVLDQYGTRLYPETWIIDRSGFIRARFDGERDWASAFATDAIRSMRRGAGCLVEFDRGKPVGRFAGLCNPD